MKIADSWKTFMNTLRDLGCCSGGWQSLASLAQASDGLVGLHGSPHNVKETIWTGWSYVVNQTVFTVLPVTPLALQRLAKTLHADRC
jgi:hypothetical protein